MLVILSCNSFPVLEKISNKDPSFVVFFAKNYHLGSIDWLSIA